VKISLLNDIEVPEQPYQFPASTGSAPSRAEEPRPLRG
jgi:hypothetical protein